MKRLKEFFHPLWFRLTHGYESIEILCSAYVSLIASLLLTVCLNTNTLSWHVFIGLLLLTYGFILSVISTNRIKDYKRKHESNKQLKINLNEYIEKEEKKDKKKIMFQYFFINTIWIPAVTLITIFGIQLAKENNQKDNSIARIENNTQLIDSLLDKTTSIYIQNIVLMDSLKSSINHVEKLTIQIDSLQKLTAQVNKKSAK